MKEILRSPVNVDGLKVCSIAALVLEVAFPPRCPDRADVVCQEISVIIEIISLGKLIINIARGDKTNIRTLFTYLATLATLGDP